MSKVHRNENPACASVLKAQPAKSMRKKSRTSAEERKGVLFAIANKASLTVRLKKKLSHIVLKADKTKRIIEPNIVLKRKGVLGHTESLAWVGRICKV